MENIVTTGPKGFLSFVRHTIRSQENILVFGYAGIGKTEICIQASQKEGFEFRYLNLSTLEAPDLVGTPMIDNGVTKYAPPGLLQSEKPYILVCDELDKALPELQNPMLELFQFRSINGVKYPIHSILATANRPDEGAFSREINTALTNRCRVALLEHSFKDWRMHVGGKLNPLILGFLSQNPDKLLVPAKAGQNNYARPSPRSWKKASDDISFEEVSEDMLIQLIGSRVGSSAAAELEVWFKYYHKLMPQIQEFLERGKFPKCEKHDELFIFGIGLTQQLKQLIKNEEIKKIQLENWIDWLNTLGPEIQVAIIQSVLSIDDMQQANLFSDFPKWVALIKSITELM